jgi:hypothetical protein
MHMFITSQSFLFLFESNAIVFKCKGAFFFIQTLLTIYEATDSDGEVLIFPDMIKYKQVILYSTHFLTSAQMFSLLVSLSLAWHVYLLGFKKPIHVTP